MFKNFLIGFVFLFIVVNFNLKNIVKKIIGNNLFLFKVLKKFVGIICIMVLIKWFLYVDCFVVCVVDWYLEILFLGNFVGFNLVFGLNRLLKIIFKFIVIVVIILKYKIVF